MYYEQVYGAAMGLPLGPIAADLLMEEFEPKAIITATNPPRL